MTNKKDHAVALLREYDALRLRLRILERELARATTEYGKTIGVWGFNKDHLRVRVGMEEGE